jgi:hypothetical protein
MGRDRYDKTRPTEAVPEDAVKTFARLLLEWEWTPEELAALNLTDREFRRWIALLRELILDAGFVLDC